MSVEPIKAHQTSKFLAELAVLAWRQTKSLGYACTSLRAQEAEQTGMGISLAATAAGLLNTSDGGVAGSLLEALREAGRLFLLHAAHRASLVSSSCSN